MDKKLLKLAFIIGFFLIIPLYQNIFAATLSLDPATVSTTADQTFDLKINVDSGADKISAVDVYILYDKSLLEPQNVKDGAFFPTVSKYLSQDGKAYVAGMMEDASSSKSGAGTVATVTFKALKNGTANLTFDCTSGSINDSNIAKDDANGTDIIQCTNNGTATVTIGTGSGNTATTVPTVSSSSNTPSSAPSRLMNSGAYNNTLSLFTSGIILLLLGIVARYFFKIKT